MRAFIQRVSESSVACEGKLVSEIGKGLCVLIGFHRDDTERDLDIIASKLINIRIFPDAAGKMNLSLLDVGGQIMLISQFTLYADMKKSGRRPSFTESASYEVGEILYDNFISKIKDSFSAGVATGVYGADMSVHIINDGPVSIMLDSRA
jgi:D-tyrosyl-tRNA(Tyr) deacylase